MSMDIKICQGKLLELLKEFDECCRTNGIHYSLHAGTLIGAVREHGFIDWDDDVDLSMTRDEFEKLSKVLKNRKHTFYLNEARGRIVQILPLDGEQIWLDIFIYDYISEKRMLQKMKLGLLLVLDSMTRTKETITLVDRVSADNYGRLRTMLFKACYYIGKPFPMTWKNRLYRKLSRDFGTGKRQFIFRSNDHKKAREDILPAGYMSAYTDIDFENTKLMISTHAHDILVSYYGDYMTPVKEEGKTSVHDAVREMNH